MQNQRSSQLGKPTAAGFATRRIPLLNRFRMNRRRRRGKMFSIKHSFVFDWLREGDIVIDCGANTGQVTARFRAAGASVYAFEPDPFAFGELKKLHGNDPEITLYNAGVGVEAGQMKLYFTDIRDSNPVKGSVSSSLFADKPAVNTDSFETVDIVDLCAFIEKLSAPIAILKIDIEGMEVAVMNALLDRGLEDRVSLILVETHENSIPSLAADTAKLKERIETLKLNNIYCNWK